MGKVLIIDDEILMVNSITDRINAELENLDYDIVKTGSDALKAIADQSINVVILDMMLPLGKDLILPEQRRDMMYGLFLLQKIRDRRPNLLVICYTVLEDDKLIKQITAFPNTLYVCKLSGNGFSEIFSELEQFNN